MDEYETVRARTLADAARRTAALLDQRARERQRRIDHEAAAARAERELEKIDERLAGVIADLRQATGSAFSSLPADVMLASDAILAQRAG